MSPSYCILCSYSNCVACSVLLPQLRYTTPSLSLSYLNSIACSAIPVQCRRHPECVFGHSGVAATRQRPGSSSPPRVHRGRGGSDHHSRRTPRFGLTSPSLSLLPHHQYYHYRVTMYSIECTTFFCCYYASGSENWTNLPSHYLLFPLTSSFPRS